MMREVTTTKTVYSLAELKEVDPEGFDKACDKLREIVNMDFASNVNDGGLDYLQDEFKNLYGIEIDLSTLAFNVGWGCEFAGCKWDVVDNEQFVQAMIDDRKTWERNPADLSLYRHLVFFEYGFEGIDWTNHRDGDLLINGIRWDWRTRDNETIVPTLDQWFEDVHGNVCQGLLDSIRNEYEYQNSEEYLLEMAEANEWEFETSGKMI